LQLSNIIVAFLPPYVTSVVQPFDQGIFISCKVQFKKKLLDWVLSQFDSSTTHQDFGNTVANVRHAIMWCSQVRREMTPQITRSNWRMSKILIAHWSVDFALDHEGEKIENERSKDLIGKSHFLFEY
jgi:hypothetical protein